MNSGQIGEDCCQDDGYKNHDLYLEQGFCRNLKLHNLQTERSLNKEIATWYKADNGYLYKVFTEDKNYSEAGKKCEQYGAKLAHVGIRNKTTKP